MENKSWKDNNLLNLRESEEPDWVLNNQLPRYYQINNLDELKKAREILSNKFSDIQHKYGYDRYRSSWEYKSLIKSEKEFTKVERELEAEEAGGTNLTTSKLTSFIKKITGLDTIKTMTSAVRGYRPVTGGSFEVKDLCGDGRSFYVGFYNHKEEVDEIVEKLRQNGFNIKHEDGHSEFEVDHIKNN